MSSTNAQIDILKNLIDNSEKISFNSSNLTEFNVPYNSTSGLIYGNSMFISCTNLTTVKPFDTSNVIKMNSMFAGCTNLVNVIFENGVKTTTETVVMVSGKPYIIKEYEPKIKGVVAQVISTNKEYETAINISIGNQMQNIITDNTVDAEYLINYLKKTEGGRITFLPISICSWCSSFCSRPSLS